MDRWLEYRDLFKRLLSEFLVLTTAFVFNITCRLELLFLECFVSPLSVVGPRVDQPLLQERTSHHADS